MRFCQKLIRFSSNRKKIVFYQKRSDQTVSCVSPKGKPCFVLSSDTFIVSYRQPYALLISGLLSHPLKLSALPETRYTHKWHCSRITITLRNRPDSQSSTSDARDPELLIKAVGAPVPTTLTFTHRPQQLQTSSSVGSIEA